MNKKTRILAFLLAIIVIMSANNYAFSQSELLDCNECDSSKMASTQQSVLPYSEEDYDAYVSAMKLQFLNTLHERIENKTIEYSQGYPILNCDDPCKKSFFLFIDGECKGQLTTTFANGDFASSFVYRNIPELTKLYNVKKAFCLVTTGNALYTYSNGVVDLLYGTIDNHKDLSNFNELGCFKNEQAINLTTIQVPTEIKDANPLYGATISSSYGLLEVPFVANHSHPVSGYSGLCWSAAIASIGAFRNDVTPLSALDLYYGLKSTYGGTPHGIPLWEQRAFSYQLLNYGATSSGLLYSTVKSWIQQYRPVYALITRTGGAHALAICGYQSAYGYYYYTFMDCNVPPSAGNNTSYVTIAVSSTSTNFTYATSYGYTYTAWERSMY